MGLPQRPQWALLHLTSVRSRLIARATSAILYADTCVLQLDDVIARSTIGPAYFIDRQVLRTIRMARRGTPVQNYISVRRQRQRKQQQSGQRKGRWDGAEPSDDEHRERAQRSAYHLCWPPTPRSPLSRAAQPVVFVCPPACLDTRIRSIY